MLKSGPAKKVTVYVGEDHQYHGQSLYAAILDFLFYRSISGATVVRGIAGFGADHHLHTTRIERLTENLPIRIEFIESPEKVQELLPKLRELAGTGLIDIQDTTVLKPSETEAATTPAAHAAASPALRRESDEPTPAGDCLLCCPTRLLESGDCGLRLSRADSDRDGLGEALVGVDELHGVGSGLDLEAAARGLPDLATVHEAGGRGDRVQVQR